MLDSLEEELAQTRAAQARREENMRDCEYDLDDCFVSVHCNSIEQEKCRMKIEILRNGGLAEFPALFTLDGEFVTIKTRYGMKFRTDDGQWIDPYIKEKTLSEKGFKLGYVRVPAWVTLSEGGKGFSGLASVRPYKFPSNFNYWTGETLDEWQARIRGKALLVNENEG